MKHYSLIIMGLTLTALAACKQEKAQVYATFEEYPVRTDELVEMNYTPAETVFTLWAPAAEDVRVMLYETGEGGSAKETYTLARAEQGTWKVNVSKDLKGMFYVFNVKQDGLWLGETPGINAHAVGVNGQRGAIIDLRDTDPAGWSSDRAPQLADLSEAVIYEMHHRDFSAHSTSGIEHKGKYLALTEEGTRSPEGIPTGIDHLKELGITHVHLLPSYDYASVDEHKLADGQYNWGYDPLNYNVPDGSYATDPYAPEVRIREFKQMVQALHKAGIRVVLDVVFNHTFDTSGSNFERTAPGYFYRMTEDGKFADASGCGNETASDRPMMRKYMIESVRYWMREYHIDGFRFDLMGIHDIETMNAIREAAQQIDPMVLIYGEGWAAATPQLPEDQLAMKANISRLPGIAAFSDELRDGLRGPWNNDSIGAFLAGIAGNEESIKFGLVGAIQHPGVDYTAVNYSTSPWATEPMQMISYVSCHDDMCLVDRLRTSIPGIRADETAKLDKLAQTAVLTSQGIPFLFAGEEVMRDKKGVHNSFNSPDSINTIDWHRLATHYDVYNYYKNMISLRRHHKAFHMGSAEQVRQGVSFLPVEQENVVAYRLQDSRDEWKDIIVVLNARKDFARVEVPGGRYVVVCRDGVVNEQGLGVTYGPTAMVPPMSALIMYLSDNNNGAAYHTTD